MVALRAVTVAVVLLMLAAGPGAAQDRRQNTPGDFDFYVLALSWAPSFCAETREQHPDRPPLQECRRASLGFTVHGLWPEYTTGYPEYCQLPPPRLNHRIIASMMDLMPSPGLIFHEWDRHGVCSGLSARRYFETVRMAHAEVKIPAQYLAPTAALTVTPDAVEQAFIKANPGLTSNEIAVTCDSKRVTEVRVCLGKDFHFHACADVDRHACRLEKAMMPPVRSAAAASTKSGDAPHAAAVSSAGHTPRTAAAIDRQP